MEDSKNPVTRGELLFGGFVLAVPFILGLLILGVAFLDPLSSSAALRRHEVGRVAGPLVDCSTSRDIWLGRKYCVDPEKGPRLSIRVAWPDGKQLDSGAGDAVIGLTSSHDLVAIELPDGRVIKSAEVGYRGTLFLVAVGLAFWWPLGYIAYATFRGEAWEKSLVRRFGIWSGWVLLVLVALHTRLWPAAAVGEVASAVVAMVIAWGWKEDTRAG